MKIKHAAVVFIIGCLLKLTVMLFLKENSIVLTYVELSGDVFIYGGGWILINKLFMHPKAKQLLNS